MKDEFHQIADQCIPEVQELLFATRKLIQDSLPEVIEVIWVKQKIIGYGIGLKKMSEHFSWIGVYSRHIILGFNYGAELEDSEKILEGAGKRFRHYKIKHLTDLKRPALKTLLKKAIEDIRVRQKSK